MKIEIIETPLRFQLHGIASVVQNVHVSEVGIKLMNKMWNVVKESNIATSGINHWVYLPENRIFVGVELLQDSSIPKELEPLNFELHRFLKHVHIGPYQLLPEKWKALKAELAKRSETNDPPSMEIYGHHCDDSSKLETTILIGLHPKPSVS